MTKKEKVKIIDLGFHPYADTFIKKDQLDKSEPIYQLSCFLNKKTGVIQNNIKTDDLLRYNQYDYSYTSSNSSYSKNYWKEYAHNLIQRFNINKQTKILEIGSNDGYLLNCLKNKTKRVKGVDTSSFMCGLARRRKIHTYNLSFNYASSKIIKNKNSTVDLIIANNVVNHSNDVVDFLKGIKNILKSNGTFIFEVPYWYNLIKNKQFDQIYHEHIYYFTVKSVSHLLKKVNLHLNDVVETNYHGGSIRFYIGLKSLRKNSKLIKSYINREKKMGLFKVKTYVNFMKHLNEKKINFLKKIVSYKKKNYKIIGIGAPAKGNTLINFVNINNTLIDYITDNSTNKINKYTPLSRIPIIPDSKIRKLKGKICAFFLVWNLEHLLKKKILDYNRNVKIISFFN